MPQMVSERAGSAASCPQTFPSPIDITNRPLSLTIISDLLYIYFDNCFNNFQLMLNY